MSHLTPLAAAVLAALAGCAATTTPQYDGRFGDATRQIKAQQIADPNAPQRNAQAAPRADGRTMREAVERHTDTYRSPPAPTVINIGVGGGSSR
jgi:hypothetical protein